MSVYGRLSFRVVPKRLRIGCVIVIVILLVVFVILIIVPCLLVTEIGYGILRNA